MGRGLIQAAPWRYTTLILSEGVLILGTIGGSVSLQLGLPIGTAGLLPKALLIMGVCQLCLYYSDLYDNPHADGNRAELLIRTLQALGATFVLLAAIYAIFPALVIGRGVLPAAAAVLAAGVVAWRLAFAWVTRRVGPRKRLLLLGASATGLALARTLEQREQLGAEIIGVVDSEAVASEAARGLPVLGGIDDIPAIVRARSVDCVVVSLANARGKLPMDKLLQMKLGGLAFDEITSVYEEYTGKIALENLRPSWVIFSPGFRKTPALMAMKRAIDVLSGVAGLILTAPLILTLAALVKLTSRGPAFYSQNRVGREGRVFTVYKLRSMCADAERASGPVWASPHGDPRVTRIGHVMRRTRLDELPQFWNILIGHMSLVGPRPERPEFVQSLAQQIPLYGQRHVLRPGLTGWAQVRYTYGASVEDAVEKLQYDLFYIKHLSIALDLFIVVETIKTVLLQRGR